MTTTKTPNTKEVSEVSILKVIRELESAKPAEKTTGDKDAALPDPYQLRASLEKKRQLINLLDGYMNKQDITAMKRQLNQAITELEHIINCVEVS